MSSIPGPFGAADAHRHLVDMLLRTPLTRGETELARELAAIATVMSFSKDTFLIVEGNHDNDLYVLLSGRVAVMFGGRVIDERTPGNFFGIISLIDPAAPRSMSSLALEPVVAARIPEPQFTQLADRFPILWRNIALVLSQRLRQQRADHIRRKNQTPIVFIGSSLESLPLAEGIQAGLAGCACLVRVWRKGIFRPSHFPLEDLERQLHEADFAVLIFGPDDTVLSRRLFYSAPRDNVVFETGLFMGALQRQRTLIVKSRHIELKLPSDLLSLTRIEFEPPTSADLSATLAPACTTIAECIARLGSR